MSRNVAFGRFLVTALCFLFIGGVSTAHAGCNTTVLTVDGQYVDLCTGPAIGPPIQNGTRLLATAAARGVRCQGCSADLTCYAAQDGTLQYHKLLIFTIHSTVDIGASFYWSPAYGPGPYYLACEATYHNNPYQTGPNWTQNVEITVQ